MASSLGELPRFVGSVAGALIAISVAIVVTGLAGYAPETIPAGMFALVWATVTAMVAAVISGRETGTWIPNPLPSSIDPHHVAAVVYGFAGLCALAASLTGPSVVPPPALLLLPLALTAFSWLLARYFAARASEDFPEGAALARWARIGVWQGGLATLSELGRLWDPGAPWAPVLSWVGGLTIVAIAVNAFRLDAKPWLDDVHAPLPLADLTVVQALGSRANPLASLLDAVEGFLGVDLRGSWALRVVREGAEPLAIAALFVGWLATGLTQIKLYEQGTVERFGRMLSEEPLGPGLHAHLPWPIDHVRREATARVLSVAVGHEGAEANAGPENVLWARQHESNEFMFLLGDGRDLVTIDGLVRYRIRDFRTYLTSNANVPALLRALVYSAVTRRTVDHSLDQVLSENLAAFTHDVAVAVQTEADALDLGVEIIDMTVGGMHPPVVVAAEYEAVVSAQVGRDTLMITARTEAERQIPAAVAAALDTTSLTQGQALRTIAAAKGDSEIFRGIRTAYAAEPELFEYRRRLEALEGALAGRRMVIVDDRLEREGATLWLAR